MFLLLPHHVVLENPILIGQPSSAECSAQHAIIHPVLQPFAHPENGGFERWVETHKTQVRLPGFCTASFDATHATLDS